MSTSEFIKQNAVGLTIVAIIIIAAGIWMGFNSEGYQDGRTYNALFSGHNVRYMTEMDSERMGGQKNAYDPQGKSGYTHHYLGDGHGHVLTDMVALGHTMRD